MALPVPAWVDAEVRRGVRDRRAPGPVPAALPLLGPHDQELLRRWARADNVKRSRASLVKEAGRGGIERADALCEQLLREGWIVRREHLVGGRWEWEAIGWRDLERLKQLLGVGSARQRDAERQELLAQSRSWLAQWADGPAIDPDLLDELARAVDELAQERSIQLEVLRTRLDLLRALADWRAAGAQGLRRDFALRARGGTKAIGAGDWRWLEASFDLERLGIASFAPMLWIAGDVGLQWGERRVEAGALQCVGLPLRDVLRVDRLSARAGALQRYWLIENRTSFERQALSVPAGELAVWVPGRPAQEWLRAIERLLQLAPAPAAISADADPAGVDIACTAAAVWERRGLAWEPRHMGVADWRSTAQQWPLNEHDRVLLQRLLAREALHPQLRALCEAMQAEGRKAEQEGWL